MIDFDLLVEEYNNRYREPHYNRIMVKQVAIYGTGDELLELAKEIEMAAHAKIALRSRHGAIICATKPVMPPPTPWTYNDLWSKQPCSK